MICFANQLNGFCGARASSERYIPRDNNFLLSFSILFSVKYLVYLQ